MGTALWHDAGDGWKPLAPARFAYEADLHDCVERAPDLLPLSGSPSLVVLGREVAIGAGSADIVAVEPDGRLVIIEVKLQRNSEARKEVVAQILAYAAGLHGLSYENLERTLHSHLLGRGYGSLIDAVRTNDQGGDLDDDAFKNGVVASLETGRIRLVLVLDEAPSDLVRLVGYLEAVADGLVIDLITVAAYDVGESRVLVPQRIDPSHDPREVAPVRKASRVTPGADGFREWIRAAPEGRRGPLNRLLEWALALERDGLANLSTTHDMRGGCNLRPLLPGEQRGLVTVWTDGTVGLWETAMRQRSPETLKRLEGRFRPDALPRNLTREVAADLLAELTAAYAEAVVGAQPPAAAPIAH
jgi:hypothetical protein